MQAKNKKQTLKQILIFTILLLTIKVQSQDFDEKLIDKIDKHVEQYIEGFSPGMAVGIVKDGRIVYEKYIGYANLEHKIKIENNTRFNIASTSKQFTALMILQLSQNDKLNLEDDIRKYLPSLYPMVEEEIKIRHLINHTSGIRDYIFILEMMNKPFWKQMGMDNGDVIELLEEQEELIFKPGLKYSYSNSGYTILAEIIEQVSGIKFNDYSKQFFEEFGMKETTFVKRYMGMIPNRADSYSDWGNGLWLSTPTVTKLNGDGFLYTTLRDQLIYEQMLQNAIGNNNVLLMKSQQSVPNSEIKTYGFGLELDGRLGREAQYHSGSTFGYHSHTNRFPDERLSVFVMSNKGNIWSGDIADEIASILLPDIEEKVAYHSLIDKSSKEVEQEQIFGQYISPDGDLIRIVKEEGKMLWRKANYNPYEIIQESQNMFSAGYNSKIKIKFFKGELIRFYPTGRTISYKRHNYLPASFTDKEGFVGEYFSSELEMSFELRLTKKDKLNIKFSNREREREIEILNRNELLASNFRMKVERDQFDRPTDILVTLNDRARNNRFRKKTNLKFQPKIETDNGSIQVTTIESKNGDASDILLTANNPNGNEIWSERFGGSSYDRASSILATEDGYLITGSTSSYGNGNYDIYVIKTDINGNKIWQNTFGNFFNDYGYSAEKTEGGFLIKGTTQNCTSNEDILNRKCTTNIYFITIDSNGKKLSEKILEEVN